MSDIDLLESDHDSDVPWGILLALVVIGFVGLAALSVVVDLLAVPGVPGAVASLLLLFGLWRGALALRRHRSAVVSQAAARRANKEREAQFWASLRADAAAARRLVPPR